jgi:Na+/melibiose symporter-like transporter
MRLASANAGLWAVGNGLVSTQLVVFLATELGARGLTISLILAAPRFAGLLRLGVPAVIARLRRRKTICLAAYLASSATLCTVPLVAPAQRYLTGERALGLLIAAWCVYHLFEYVGTVALWSWLGDLTPQRIRGRLLGRRERWLIVGRIGGVAASAALALAWRAWLPSAPPWQPLALSAAVGALLMASAVFPLAAMPGVENFPSATPRLPWRTLALVVRDPPYQRLLVFSCWFALASGITLSAQQLYPIRVLQLPYEAMLLLSSLMWAGQCLVAPSAGRLIDRYGSSPVMTFSLLVASAGLLFFLAATPQRSWVLVGAYIAWIAYAGLNVGLDKTKLHLAAPGNNAPYLAAYHALSDLSNGAAIIGGGLLYDRLVAGGSGALALYAQLFLAGWLARSSAALFLVGLADRDSPKGPRARGNMKIK